MVAMCEPHKASNHYFSLDMGEMSVHALAKIILNFASCSCGMMVRADAMNCRGGPR